MNERIVYKDYKHAYMLLEVVVVIGDDYNDPGRHFLVHILENLIDLDKTWKMGGKSKKG